MFIFEVDLGIIFSQRDQRFAYSNPAEVDGFFRYVLKTCTPRGTVNPESEIFKFVKVCQA